MPKNRPLSSYKIGYSALETCHDTRFDNERTFRARVVNADGSNDREIAADLIASDECWTQFGGWLSDGRAIVLSGHQSQKMAEVEQAESRIIVSNESRHMEIWLVEPESGGAQNISAPDRVSLYNAAVQEWPPCRQQFALSVVNDGVGCLYIMNHDGSGKTPLSATTGYCYGLAISPDGQRAAWHEDYQIRVTEADGSCGAIVDTGNAFNFGPLWSPDGKWILFVSGKSNMGPSIYLAALPTLTCHRVAKRSGYIGVASIMDAGDWREGGTDMCCWSPDSRAFFFTARARDGNVELFRYSLAARRRRRVTYSPPTSHMSHPNASSDGQLVATMGLVGGARNIFVSYASGETCQVTHYSAGQAAIIPKLRQ